MMDHWAAIVSASASLAWPLLVACLFLYFHKDIAIVVGLFRRQLASGAALKWKDFEFKGIEIEAFEAKDGRGYQQIVADKPIFEKREDSYAKNKNLFLVHRVRASGFLHPINNLPTYDIAVYLVSHKNFGHLNDIKEVHYYFGRHFGISLGEFGTQYVVKNGTDGFAVKTNAYGPTLCEARIIFHDDTQTYVSRYIDFEGTGYRFDSSINVKDVAKLKARLEQIR
jgi:hypothetical protein